jgi:thioredoxin 1
MKTPMKILIVAALAGAVIAVVALKNGKAPTESNNGAPSPAATNTPAETTGAPTAPAVAAVKLPRLLDLGAGKCIPCKMMAPILEELRKEYAGRLEVTFIDVWVNPDAGKPYGIEMIPTQIFFDAEGRELFRHVGFFAKEDILGKWKELGVDLGGKSEEGK